MSNPDETVTPASNDIYATLVRGRVYFLGNREFLNGVAEKVSAADRDWLTAHAVDQITIEEEGEHQHRQKFKFSTSAEPDEVPATRARRRG